MLYCKLLAIKHLAFIDILNFPTSSFLPFFFLSTNFPLPSFLLLLNFPLAIVQYRVFECAIKMVFDSQMNNGDSYSKSGECLIICFRSKGKSYQEELIASRQT